MAGLITSNPFRPPTAAAPVAKVLVWAGPSGGKSHFLLTAPKLAVADAENRIHMFAGRTEFQPFESYSTQSIEAIQAAISYLETGFKTITLYDPILKENIPQLLPDRTGVHDYQTFGIDGLTVIWEQRQFDQQNQIKGQRDGFVDRDWGDMKRDYKGLMNRLIKLPMNVCCTARLADERDPNTRKVIGEKADVERSTAYAFDLVIRLVEGEDGAPARDAIIIKQTGNVYKEGERVKNVTWDTLVTPVISRLQAARDAVQAQQQAVRDLVATWREAITALGKDQAAADSAAKQIILRKTGKNSSSDLTMDEIATLKALFTNPDSLKAELPT